MNNRKIPLRKCLATQEICPKKELVRVVRSPSGDVCVDLTGKANGRGAYLKKTKEAIDRAVKSNCLGKALGCKIPQEVYEQLYKLVAVE